MTSKRNTRGSLGEKAVKPLAIGSCRCSQTSTRIIRACPQLTLTCGVGFVIAEVLGSGIWKSGLFPGGLGLDMAGKLKHAYLLSSDWIIVF